MNQTSISGTAVSFRELEGNLYKAAEWKTSLDCDFLISIELEEWPASASEWITRKRHWPQKEVSIHILLKLNWLLQSL